MRLLKNLKGPPLFQLRAIDKRRLKQKLGTLKNSDIKKIKQLVYNMMSVDEE